MHLNIQGRHLAVTPALNQYVKDKIKKIKYYFDHIIHAHVVLEVIKGNQFAEITVTVEHHHFHNRINSADMYKSIDLLFDKLEIQVRRYKEYKQDHHKSKQKLHEDELNQAQQVQDIDIQDIQIQPKPMSALEATLQMSIDTKEKYLGFLDSDHSFHPSFLVKESENQFKLVNFEEHWELRHIELKAKDKLETHSIENIKFPTETIEDAIMFIEHNDVEHRVFKSVRANSHMLLFKIKDKRFGVIRLNEV